MKRNSIAILPVCLLFLAAAIRGAGVPEFRDLFNGKDLAGWVNVNTAPDTWSVENGMLVCSGHPIGVMRTDRQYENFVLHVEWMHTEPGGNSGMFLWSARTLAKGKLSGAPCLGTTTSSVAPRSSLRRSLSR